MSFYQGAKCLQTQSKLKTPLKQDRNFKITSKHGGCIFVIPTFCLHKTLRNTLEVASATKIVLYNKEHKSFSTFIAKVLCGTVKNWWNWLEDRRHFPKYYFYLFFSFVIFYNVSYLHIRLNLNFSLAIFSVWILDSIPLSNLKSTSLLPCQYASSPRSELNPVSVRVGWLYFFRHLPLGYLFHILSCPHTMSAHMFKICCLKILLVMYYYYFLEERPILFSLYFSMCWLESFLFNMYPNKCSCLIIIPSKTDKIQIVSTFPGGWKRYVFRVNWFHI